MDLFENLPDQKPQDEDKERTRKIMGLFGLLMTPPDLLTVLMDFGGLELSLDHRRFLNGPVIQHKSQFAECTPKWMFGYVASERLEIILEEQKQGLTTGWQVGAIELATALYPATHDAPMQHDYAEIYLWASAQACAKHFNKPREHYIEVLGGQVVDDHQIIEKSGRYYHTYHDLCQTIRSRVVKVQTSRDQGTRSLKRTKEGQPPSTEGKGGYEQLSLF